MKGKTLTPSKATQWKQVGGGKNVVVQVSPGDLKPHPWNAKIYHTGGGDDLRLSIKSCDIQEPLIVSRHTLHIIAGHMRHQVAQELGLETVPVRFVDFADETEELQALLACNVSRAKTEGERAGEYQLHREIERTKAKARMSLAARTAKVGSQGVPNSAPPDGPPAGDAAGVPTGKAVELAGAAVGWGASKAKEFDYVETHAPQLVDEIRADRRSVHGAYVIAKGSRTQSEGRQPAEKPQAGRPDGPSRSAATATEAETQETRSPANPGDSGGATAQTTQPRSHESADEAGDATRSVELTGIPKVVADTLRTLDALAHFLVETEPGAVDSDTLEQLDETLRATLMNLGNFATWTDGAPNDEQEGGPFPSRRVTEKAVAQLAVYLPEALRVTPRSDYLAICNRCLIALCGSLRVNEAFLDVHNSDGDNGIVLYRFRCYASKRLAAIQRQARRKGPQSVEALAVANLTAVLRGEKDARWLLSREAMGDSAAAEKGEQQADTHQIQEADATDTQTAADTENRINTSAGDPTSNTTPPTVIPVADAAALGAGDSSSGGSSEPTKSPASPANARPKLRPRYAPTASELAAARRREKLGPRWAHLKEMIAASQDFPPVRPAGNRSKPGLAAAAVLGERPGSPTQASGRRGGGSTSGKG